MYYDSVYKNNPDFCGQKPSQLLVEIFKKPPRGKEALDLGCGQGRDAFYVARKKFNVTAVDNSKVAISQIESAMREKKIKNIQTVCQNIAKFKIEPDKFSLINCNNVLQFLPRKIALKIIENIKKNILPGGFIAIVSFTVDNPPSKRRRMHFRRGELGELFKTSDFKIHYYLESIILDNGHAGQPEPHQHGVVKIIAQKIKAASK